MHDRRQDRATLIRLFERGDSAQLLAPRRVGKTWLMQRLAEDLKAKGWLAVYLDVEGMRTEDEALRDLCRKLQESDPLHRRVFDRLKVRVGRLVSGDWSGDPVQEIGRVDAKDFSEALIASLNDDERDTVILVDEITLFLLQYVRRDPEGARDFLYRLRRLRQAYPRVRWLLTGSIGLDVVARRGNLLGALVDVEVHVLQPFDRAEARSYIGALCAAEEVLQPFSIGDDDFEFLAAELGWLAPFYLRLLSNRVQPSGERGENGHPTATRGDIEVAFEVLLEPQHRGSFAVWEEHLDKNFEARETDLLRKILSTCCEQVDG